MLTPSRGDKKINPQRYRLPDEHHVLVQQTMDVWDQEGKIQRLWDKDASLWTGGDEAQWLGWLGITEEQLGQIPLFESLKEEVRAGADGTSFFHILLLGMGGSSLGPEVLQMTFGRQAGFPKLYVLDSTDPAQVETFEKKINFSKALFIVSSKSGSTLEPNIFKQYFFNRVQEALGPGRAGSRFIAITDPGSKMQQVAEEDGFRHIFYGKASIGGRYSVLSNFGMIPAAFMGLDVAQFLNRTRQMVEACLNPVSEKNPGVVLGIILGVLATRGRDKVTVLTSPELKDFGAWLEQLLAESTGKLGKGLIPVDLEDVGSPDVYGSDRLFVEIRLESEIRLEVEEKLNVLVQAGHPLIRISVLDRYSLGQEFFRWEMATAVAGAIMEINPFDQPDVEASKIETRKLTHEFEKTGSFPSETPFWEDGTVQLLSDPHNEGALLEGAGEERTLCGFLRAHFNRFNPGDYFGLLAYLEMNESHQEELQKIRHAVRDQKHVATCLGFGPRFLHSTGQAYKGGPNSGVFLQITCEDEKDLAVPAQKYTFGVVKAAQARGDFQVLIERNRRLLRVHLPSDVKEGLVVLRKAVEDALSPL